MNTSETLKKLLRLWAILWDVSPQTAMIRVQKALKIETFTDNEPAQKLAVTYLQHLLRQKGDDETNDDLQEVWTDV